MSRVQARDSSQSHRVRHLELHRVVFRVEKGKNVAITSCATPRATNNTNTNTLGDKSQSHRVRHLELLYPILGVSSKGLSRYFARHTFFIHLIALRDQILAHFFSISVVLYSVRESRVFWKRLCIRIIQFCTR